MIRILYLVPMNQLLLFTGGGDKKSNYTRPPGEVGQADRPAVRYATKSARSRGGDMPGKNLRVRSSEGGEFDCYLATPRAGGKVPAIALASGAAFARRRAHEAALAAAA